jgi:penicillin-binding protein 1A
VSQSVVPSRAARHAARESLRQRSLGSHATQALAQVRRVRFTWRLMLWLALPFAAVAIGGGMGFLYAFSQVPAPLQSRGAETIFIYDNNNKVIGRIIPQENREFVPLKDIPPVVKQAVLSAEDHDFYEHGAISYRALGRAVVANLKGGGVSQGGSTLAQQYIKVVYDERDKTMLRKAREAMLAVKLEQQYSKDEVLEFYLNTIYFGRGGNGVKAAAKAYFGRGDGDKFDLKKITPQQAAFLAGIIRNPEFYAKKDNWDEAKARRNRVLKIMGDEGYLTQAQVAKAQAAPLGIKDWKGLQAGAANSKAPYFVEKVRLWLNENPQIGADMVKRGGLKVETTLDSGMQDAAVKAVEETLDDAKRDPKAALVAIDSKTGAVKAFYGGRDFAKNQFNYAADGARQLGSTIKPFVLAEWLEQGYSIDSNLTGKSCWLEDSLCNYGKQDFGELMPLKQAVIRSANTPFIEMQEKLGRENVIGRLQRAGIDAKLTKAEKDPILPKELSLALGTAESSTLQLTSAFGTFANDGVHLEPYIVSKVTSLDGKTVYYKHKSEQQVVMSENTARTVSAVLSDVLRFGTGQRALLDRPAAGKTGTTSNNIDARFAGYVPNGLVASVWLGYDNGKSAKPKQLVNIEGFAHVDGGTIPAKVWKRFMELALALEDEPVEPFGPWQPGGEIISPTTTAPPTTTLPPTTTTLPEQQPGFPGNTDPGQGQPGATLPTLPVDTQPDENGGGGGGGPGDGALNP